MPTTLDDKDFITEAFNTPGFKGQEYWALLWNLQKFYNSSYGLMDRDSLFKMFNEYDKLAEHVLGNIKKFICNADNDAKYGAETWREQIQEILSVLSFCEKLKIKQKTEIDLILIADLDKQIKEIQQRTAVVSRGIQDELVICCLKEQKLFLDKYKPFAHSSRIDMHILNSLGADTPKLPWQLNNRYHTGPYRSEVTYNQYDSSYNVVIPLYKELKGYFPNLIKLAEQNCEPNPSEQDVRLHLIRWQQRLLREDRSISISESVKEKLCSEPPRLPWELNYSNSSAPGFRQDTSYKGANTIIPLRSKLQDKYRELIAQAVNNPEPGPVIRVIAPIHHNHISSSTQPSSYTDVVDKHNRSQASDTSCVLS